MYILLPNVENFETESRVKPLLMAKPVLGPTVPVLFAPLVQVVVAPALNCTETHL